MCAGVRRKKWLAPLLTVNQTWGGRAFCRRKPYIKMCLFTTLPLTPPLPRFLASSLPPPPPFFSPFFFFFPPPPPPPPPPLLTLSGWGCESQGVGVNTKEGGWHLQYLSAQQLHCTHLSLLYVNTGRPRGHKHPHKFLQIVSLANIHLLKAAGITEHMAALKKGTQKSCFHCRHWDVTPATAMNVGSYRHAYRCGTNIYGALLS